MGSRRLEGTCRREDQLPNEDWSRFQNKPPCILMCGKRITDPDEEVPANTLNWASPDGQGASGWYCNRVLLRKYSHEEDREACVNQLSNNIDNHGASLTTSVHCWPALEGLQARLPPRMWPQG